MRLHSFTLGLLATTLGLACSVAQGQSPPENSFAKAKTGVTVNSPQAFVGYTLVAPMNATSTYLIDMEGRIVNEWKSDYTPALSAYLLENGHLLRPGSEGGFGAGGPGSGGRIQEFTWEGELVWDYSFGDNPLRPHHDICRLPNGNVLVVATDKKTRDEVLAAGRRPETLGSQLLTDCILEIKPTGKTTGEIVWRWHAWDHLVQDTDKSKPHYGDVAEHPERIDINFSTDTMDRMMKDPQQLARLRSLGYVGGGTAAADPPRAGDKNASPNDSPPTPPGKGSDDVPSRGGPPGGGPPGMEGDWMHVNSVAYNSQLDQIMISVHEFSEIWVIDHSTTIEEAASHQGGKRGKGGDLLYRWGNPRAYRSGTNADQRSFAQHCAHWIADGLPGAGHLLFFNNGMGRPRGEYSSADEVALPLNAQGTYDKEEFIPYAPDQPTWTYFSPDKSSFFSNLISGAQRLPNGNTFICSGNQGILFEVTPSGEIVWQYKQPGVEGFGGPGRQELVPNFLRDILQMTVEQREKLDALQTDVKAKTDKLLTDEQRAKLTGPRGPGGGPPRFGVGFGFGFGGPPPGGPGGPGAPGGPDGPGRPPRFQPPKPGTIIPPPIVEQLALTTEQATELQTLQQHVDQQLGQIWTAAQKEQLQEMERNFAQGPGFGPPPFGPPGGRPPGGGPPGPGGRRGPGGPGGPGRGPGGIFRSYRYGLDYPGVIGRTLTPGEKLDVVADPARRPADDKK